MRSCAGGPGTLLISVTLQLPNLHHLCHCSIFCVGESAPVLRGPGTMVRAGTLNCGSGVLRVRTTAAAGDTAVARMAALVEQAASQQSPAEALVARVCAVLCCAVLCLPCAAARHPWVQDRLACACCSALPHPRAPQLMHALPRPSCNCSAPACPMPQACSLPHAAPCLKPAHCPTSVPGPRCSSPASTPLSFWQPASCWPSCPGPGATTARCEPRRTGPLLQHRVYLPLQLLAPACPCTLSISQATHCRLASPPCRPPPAALGLLVPPSPCHCLPLRPGAVHAGHSGVRPGARRAGRRAVQGRRRAGEHEQGECIQALHVFLPSGRVTWSGVCPPPRWPLVPAGASASHALCICWQCALQVGVVTFDKTGTLTKGQFQVVDCQVRAARAPFLVAPPLGLLRTSEKRGGWLPPRARSRWWNAR